VTGNVFVNVILREVYRVLVGKPEGKRSTGET